LAAFRKASALQHANPTDVHPLVLPTARGSSDGQIAMLTGDFAEAERQARIVAELRVNTANLNWRASQGYAMWAMAAQHDGGGMRAYMREAGRTGMTGGMFGAAAYAALEDWQAVSRTTREAVAATKRTAQQLAAELPFAYSAAALAMAHLGDIKGAEALIAKSPGDCDGCLLARAQIAQMQGQHDRADFWFTRAEANAPSTPFAYHQWGRALLARGQADAAIAKFQLASQKGPKFADPLEGWGEALMAKNQSHLALAKFAAAEKYAPNWGRLHLKWAEALVYAGKKDDATKHFARAGQLDLTPSEKSELARMNHV
jgi:tetratricopeptide (TPR) repeat protein